MFKENPEKVIQYILSLPDKEQKLIVQRVAKKARVKKAKKRVRNNKGNMTQMAIFLDRLGNRLPKNYKFNRQEANER